jgi:BirA family biotin operon repressor/biotin-[acetyl-CoA-carboxylase] ligase
MLGTPRRHYRLTDSTNARLRHLAERGAPHGTLVTAEEQTAGRGRQGRTWTAPPRRALLLSLLIRHAAPLLPLAAGVAVAETAEAFAARPAQIKWPNDVLIAGRKVAGILVEARPQANWAVLGIGLNVAIEPPEFPPELQQTATSLGLEPHAAEAVLAELLGRLTEWTVATDERILDSVGRRDALRGRPVSWAGGSGIAAGIDPGGRLIVDTRSGPQTLGSGEVHLQG